MNAVLTLLLLFAGQLLLLPAIAVLAQQHYTVGQRVRGDQLLLMDRQQSRLAGSSESPSVTFNYHIEEPISRIEIISDDNISARVQFSYENDMVVGEVSLLDDSANASLNVDSETTEPIEDPTEDLESESTPAASFDVVIKIFGFNQSVSEQLMDILLYQDERFQGNLHPYAGGNNDYEEEEDKPDNPGLRLSNEYKDKIIEIGQRQPDDELIYETYQTSPDSPPELTNLTVIFYYIDKDFITYIKFVVFDHFLDKVPTEPNYLPPVAEYSNYSPSSIKATITDYNVKYLFVQMFVYGYRGVTEPPPHYKPFLNPSEAGGRSLSLTPLQRMQLLLMTGRATTPASTDEDYDEDKDEDDDEDKDEETQPIRPEDMEFDHVPSRQSRAAPERLYASMMGLMLYAVV